MSEFMNEQDFKKKMKKFTILGIILVILGFACFIGGPIIIMTTHLFYLFFISFLGVFMLVPGFILLSLGTQRKMLAYQAQSTGPVAVEATERYGAPAAKEMTKAVKEGLTEDKEEIFCKFCGNRIDADSEFCKFCGKKLN